ncbi:MAG: hypothetical protein ACRETC_03865 [Gammaproteobacteria bacterium]
MLQRIAAIVITVIGVALAIIVGIWVLVALGVIALVAALIFFIRTRFGQGATRHSGDVIEGEFTVVDEEEHKRDE